MCITIHDNPTNSTAFYAIIEYTKILMRYICTIIILFINKNCILFAIMYNMCVSHYLTFYHVRSKQVFHKRIKKEASTLNQYYENADYGNAFHAKPLAYLAPHAKPDAYQIPFYRALKQFLLLRSFP